MKTDQKLVEELKKYGFTPQEIEHMISIYRVQKDKQKANNYEKQS